MTLRTLPQLTSDNAIVATPRPDKTKTAVLRWAAAHYVVSWGTQDFAGPHMHIDGQYGCALSEFFETHLPINELENTWFKATPVLAMQLTEDMNLEDLTTKDGNKESSYDTIPAGTWIIRNPSGEQYTNTPVVFAAKYTTADDSVEKTA